MISLEGMSFGYGIRAGFAHPLHDAEAFSRAEKNRCVPVFEYLPTLAQLTALAKEPNVEFCVIPSCSVYSHLAASTWFNNIPALAIRNPPRLINGTILLADFDKGLLLIAESESESCDLLTRASEFGGIGENTFDTIAPNQKTNISVLAEITSGHEIRSAFSDGADGLGVINAERLFGDIEAHNSGFEAFINAAKCNPKMLPFLVRFFDPDLSGQHVTNGSVPNKALGYRGVRVLEVDDSWLKLFVNGLERLDLDEVVVVVPMVTSVAEVQRFRRRLGTRWTRLGVTVETPAAALLIKDFIEVSEFIQIGLNDLTQYTMAWDRDVPNEERLPQAEIVEPVAELVASVAAACTTAGVPYTLGLDLRPSKILVDQLSHLGISSISCAPLLVGRWKHLLMNQ